MENYIFSPVNFATRDQTLKSTTKKVQTSKHYEQKSIEHGYMVLFNYSLYHKKSAISFFNFIIDSIVSRGTSIVIVTVFFTIHVFFARILLAMTAVIVCFSPQELIKSVCIEL